MHRGGHQRCKTVLVSKIDKRTDADEPLSRFPILLRRCDQQRRPALGIMPVWIDVINQAQFNERVPLNCDSSNEFARRNRNARRRFRSKHRHPEHYQKYDGNPKDESPFEHAHMQGWASHYTGCVQYWNGDRIERRTYLRASPPAGRRDGFTVVNRDWTYPVERCMFPAVQIPTHALIHFDPVRCTQYIVGRAT